MGILAALINRQQTGEGQAVDNGKSFLGRGGSSGIFSVRNLGW